MNGIAGFICETPVDPGALFSALSSLAALRGGGAPRIWLQPHEGGGALAGVGTTRMATPGRPARAPACVGDITVVLDGSFYNAADVAQVLGEPEAAADHDRLLALAYARWGEDAFERLRGVWSCVVLDASRRRAVFSRDRFGSRPLYVARVAHGLWFSSEIAPLLQVGVLPFVPNRRVAANYLVSGECEAGPETFFQGVLVFPAAHTQAIDLRAPLAASSPRPYYVLPLGESTLPFPEYVAELKKRFFDAVAEQGSGGALATCLSGGIDSSSITCAVAELSRTGTLGNDLGVSVGYCADTSRVGERVYIESVATRLGRRVDCVSPAEEEFRDQALRTLQRFDEPFTSSSVVAQSFVFRRARALGADVILDGQCADQFLAGYSNFYLVYYRNLVRARRYLTAWRLRQDYSRRVGPFPLVAPFPWNWVPFADARHGVADLYAADADVLREFYACTRPAARDGLDFQGESTTSTRILDQLAVQVRSTSVPALLRYIDRNSSAAGVEDRTPFLDPRLVEWMLSVPEDYLYEGAKTKFTLRSAMKDLLPPLVYDRVDKIGFQADPRWTRVVADTFGPELWENGSRFEEDLFDAAGVARFLQATPSPCYDFLLWRIVNLKVWLRRFSAAPAANAQSSPAAFATGRGDAALMSA